jgi:hypothetical protein
VLRRALVPVIAVLAAACTGGIEEAAEELSPSPSSSRSTSATSSSASVSPGPDGSPSGEAAIVVLAPASGDQVGSPVTIAGTAEVFEGTVAIRLLDAEGQELAAGFATTSCGSGCRGDYSTDLSFFVEDRQDGSVEVFEIGAEDGSVQHLVRVPVVLVP